MHFSDKDYDTDHPAGTSLKDVIGFDANTPYPFIKNGYTGKETTHVRKLLSMCSAEDFILTFGKPTCNGYKENRDDIYAFNLYFAQKPTAELVHNFTISILDDAGKTWKLNYSKDFSK